MSDTSDAAECAEPENAKEVAVRVSVARLALGTCLVVCLSAGALLASGRTVEGVVYFDENANGIFDIGERGAADVAVSDGVTVVQASETGGFVLELDEAARFVFVSTPSSGQAIDRWYVPVSPEAVYDFPLEAVDEEGPVVFAQVSDIHYAPTPEEFDTALNDRRMEILPGPILDALRDDINAIDADFVIFTGDIVADAKRPTPDQVDEWMAAMMDEYASTFDAPVYGVVGNHDVVRDEAIGKTIYETYAGPTYYSFDVKGTHFVVLDTQQLVGESLVYTVDERQITWLEQDLATVAPESPIIVFCHEPTYDWADTPEGMRLFELLQESDITALLTGHWHTNEVLREEPFYELTSGAACGAWWEGDGPDGTGFGYRVFRGTRGTLDSIWERAGEDRVDVPGPSTAVLAWADRLEAKVWGEASEARYGWDDEAEVDLVVHFNGLWSSVAANLNVATLSDGYHNLILEFAMTDGRVITASPSYYVSNPDLLLGEIFDHPETFRGKIVAAPELQVRATMGSDISAYDETKTIIIADFPFPVARKDWISVTGMYHPTSASPLKAYDHVFYVLLEEEDAE